MEDPNAEKIPADIFKDSAVTVAGYSDNPEDIQAACRVIFGRLLAPEEFADLIVAPDHSLLIIEARRDDATIELKLGYRLFNGTHDYLLYVDEDTNKRVIEFDNIVNQETAPEGLETLLFVRQVRSFRKYGLDEIRFYAEGHAGHPTKNGYYVWARFGFVMFLTGFAPELAAAEFASAETTLELFTQDSGADWWHNHGSGREAVFYLDEESECSLALLAYLQAKGIKGNDESASH